MSISISTRDMTREEWLAQRRTGLGGSDAATVLGLNPWKTPLRLFLEKSGIEQDEDEDNDAMWFGREVEPVVAKRFAENTGYRIRQDHKIRRDPTHPFLIGNVDRIIEGDPRGPGVLEIKTTTRLYERTWTTDVPPQWLAQLYHYLMVTGYKWGYIAYLVDRTYKEYYVEVDSEVEKILADLRAHEVRFWTEHVMTGIAPEPTTQDDVDFLFPEHRPESTHTTEDPEFAELTYRYKDVKAQIKALEEESEAIKLRLTTEVRDAEALVDGLSGMTLFTYKTQSRTNVDGKALREKYPSIYAEFEKVSRFRVLRPK